MVIPQAPFGKNADSFVNVLHDRYIDFSDSLRNQSLPSHLKRAQRFRLSQFIAFVQKSAAKYQADDETGAVKDRAANDYLDYLQYFLKARPSTINKALNTINEFYEGIGLTALVLNRLDFPSLEPQAISDDDWNKYIRAAEECSSVKHKAVALLMGTTGIRAIECITLDVTDFDSANSSLTIKQSEFDETRTITLDGRTCLALEEWLTLRKERFNRLNETALFLNPQRRRMSQAGVNLVVRKLGQDAGLTLTPQNLRDTLTVRSTEVSDVHEA